MTILREAYYIQQVAVVALVSPCGIMTGTMARSIYALSVRRVSAERSLLKGGYIRQLKAAASRTPGH
jgi:hypothetical protein